MRQITCHFFLTLVHSNLRTSPFLQACLLAAQSPHSGDWLLALAITFLCLTTRRRGRPHRCTVWRLGPDLGSPHLPLRQFGRCHWHPCLGLQSSSQPSCETPRLKWLYQPCHRRSQHSRAEGTSRSGSERREASWRLHSYPVAWWQTSGLGRHSAHHSGCFIRDSCQSISRSRCRTSCWKKVSEICWTVYSLWISSIGSWDTWTYGLGYDFFISELGVRSHNTHATRLTVVTFSSKSACSFSDITPFSSVRPSQSKMKSTHGHSSLVLVFLVFNPPGIYTTTDDKQICIVP